MKGDIFPHSQNDRKSTKTTKKKTVNNIWCKHILLLQLHKIKFTNTIIKIKNLFTFLKKTEKTIFNI